MSADLELWPHETKRLSVAEIRGTICQCEEQLGDKLIEFRLDVKMVCISISCHSKSIGIVNRPDFISCSLYADLLDRRQIEGHRSKVKHTWYNNHIIFVY